ncbi:hypothetical protein MTO96_006537 [Rhipicephalus appendiculatus]
MAGYRVQGPRTVTEHELRDRRRRRHMLLLLLLSDVAPAAMGIQRNKGLRRRRRVVLSYHSGSTPPGQLVAPGSRSGTPAAVGRRPSSSRSVYPLPAPPMACCCCRGFRGH